MYGSDGALNTTDALYHEGAAVIGDFNATVVAMAGSTAKGLARAAIGEVSALGRPEWTGLGLEWLRQLLGKREWRIDCMDMYVRL